MQSHVAPCLNRRRALTALLAALAGVMLIPAAAEQTIYRCEQADGNVIFSDRPCGQQAKIHRSRNNLSVVAAPSGLAERIEANQAFLHQRREQLREPPPASEPAPEAHPRPPQTQVSAPPSLQLPYWPPPIEPPRPSRPTEREPGPRDQPFSALSGRLPGTVRRREAPAENPGDQ